MRTCIKVGIASPVRLTLCGGDLHLIHHASTLPGSAALASAVRLREVLGSAALASAVQPQGVLMTFKPLPRDAAGGLSQNGLPYLIVLAHVLYSCVSTLIVNSRRSTLQQSKGLRLRVACSVACLLLALLRWLRCAAGTCCTIASH